MRLYIKDTNGDLFEVALVVARNSTYADGNPVPLLVVETHHIPLKSIYIDKENDELILCAAEGSGTK